MRLRTRASDPRTLLALDLETTGYDPLGAEILEIGTVPITDGVIRIGGAHRTLVRPVQRSAVDGIVAHHLRPSEVVDAPRLAEVLPRLLGAIRSVDALLVHHAPLDVVVLRRACEAAGLLWPKPTVVDTMDLIEKVRRRERGTPRGRRLPHQLSAAREALGLPPHEAHQAVADAVATAELYLALRARLAR